MATLVDYSGSSEEESDLENEERKLTTAINTQHKAQSLRVDQFSYEEPSKKKMKSQSSALPLPEEVLGMFTNTHSSAQKQSDCDSDSSLHKGRKRTFAHMEGNWATFVYVPYDIDGHFLRLREELFKCLRPYGDFQPMDDHHVSLSRTVVIRHHWIEPLLDSLRQGVQTGHLKRSLCGIQGVHIYTNDENTRSFLGLTVQDAGILKQATDVANQAFSEFRLPPYYKNASYHLSIGWALDDITTSLPHSLLTRLKDIVDMFLEDEPSFSVIDVREICLKTGNKIYTCPLSDT